MVVKSADGYLQHFGRVGLFALLATALSLWLAGRVQPAEKPSPAPTGSDKATHPPDMYDAALDYPTNRVGSDPL
jgi:hypothetical protein